LIELLVVIAIIAILAALLLPGLAKAKQSSQDSYCKNNMKEIAVAVAVYGTDNGDRLPLITTWGKEWGVLYGSDIANPPSSYPDNLLPLVYMEDVLFPYLGTNKNAANRLTATQLRAYRPQAGIYACPSAINTDPNNLPFDANYFANNDGVTYIWMTIFGSGDGSGWQSFTDPVSGRKATKIASPHTAVDVWEIPYWNWVTMPHFKGMNICHPDGSVTRFKGYPTMADWYWENSWYGWNIPNPSPNLH
jgi:type II secretory pathway pseudopilin PulG